MNEQDRCESDERDLASLRRLGSEQMVGELVRRGYMVLPPSYWMGESFGVARPPFNYPADCAEYVFGLVCG